jgi:quinol monooxygenase YgiN
VSIRIEAKDELLERRKIMVIERAELPIVQGREGEFEKQFAAGVAHLRGAQGCLSVSLARGIENPSKYLLLLEWEALAAHQAFTATEAFATFVALIRPYLAGKPNTEHFAPVKSP